MLNDNLETQNNNSGNDNNNIVYITTTRSYTVNNSIVYNNVTAVELDDSDYVLEMLDTRVSKINVINHLNGFFFNCIYFFLCYGSFISININVQ